MRFGSVCSGIEAASVAWHPLGWQAAWLAEIEPFPCAVLAHHYPTVPNLGDMTTIYRRVLTGEAEAPDLLCGGTPCQAFSVAGLRNSLDDDRGNLSLKFVELADAIDHVRARAGNPASIVFWENVPGVLSTKDNAFGCFLAGLAGEDEPLQPPGGRWSNAGAVYGPARAIAWRTLDAQYTGLAQRRKRVFVVASARNGFDPAQVLFEWDGVRRDTAPSREAGQSAARGVEIGPSGGCYSDLSPTLDTRAKDGPIRNQLAPAVMQAFGGNQTSGPRSVSSALSAHGGTGRMDFESETFITHSLRGEGFDASEDGTGRGTPLVPVGVTIHGTDPTVQKVASYDELAQCLRARTPGNIDNSSTTVVQQPVAFAQNSRNELRLEGGDGQRTGALSTGGGKPGQGVPMIAFPANLSGTQCASAVDVAPSMGAANPTAVAFGVTIHGTHPTVQKIASYDEIAQCLRARTPGNIDNSSTSVVMQPVADANSPPPAVFYPVRYGYHQQDTLHHEAGIMSTLPSGSNNNVGHYTATVQAMQVRRLTPVECEKLQGFEPGYTAIPWRGKPADQCPDGPRYKSLGNSWAVPCARWIGKRIQAEVERTA